MKTVLVLLFAVCAFTCRDVNAGKHANCAKDFYAVKREIKIMIEEGTAPDCTKELKMEQFKCTAGEDNKKDQEIGVKYKQWYEELDEDTKEKVKMCSVDMWNAAVDGKEDSMSEECMNQIREIREKVMAYVEAK